MSDYSLDMKARRKTEDLDFFSHPERWPAGMGGWCAVKKQPWAKDFADAEPHSDFGVIHKSRPTVVYKHPEHTGGDLVAIVEYQSLDELVETWSVD